MIQSSHPMSLKSTRSGFFLHPFLARLLRPRRLLPRSERSTFLVKGALWQWKRRRGIRRCLREIMRGGMPNWPYLQVNYERVEVGLGYPTLPPRSCCSPPPGSPLRSSVFEALIVPRLNAYSSASGIRNVFIYSPLICLIYVGLLRVSLLTGGLFSREQQLCQECVRGEVNKWPDASVMRHSNGRNRYQRILADEFWKRGFEQWDVTSVP